MNVIQIVARALPMLLLALANPIAAQIVWPKTPNLDGALTRARSEGKLLVVALIAPGERTSQRMLEEHYEDRVLGTLAASTVPLLYRIEGSGLPSPDEQTIRDRYLQAEADAPIAVPQHLFIDPKGADGQGTLISAVAYDLTIGQLEWAFVDAIRKLTPDFAWDLGDRARAPERLRYGAADAGDALDADPPSEDAVEDALTEAKKSRGVGGGGMVAIMERFGVILRSPEKDAQKYATSNLRSLGGRGQFIAQSLRAIGELSPPVWHEVVSPYLEDREPKHREEAARALELLRAEKSAAAILKLLKGESDPDVRGRALRALARVAPADKRSVQTLARVIAKDKSVDMRAQATAALACIEDPLAVRENLQVALADDSSTVRAAAAYVAASRRDPSLLPLLEAVAAKETDAEAKGWIERAVEVVKQGDLRSFDAFVERVLRDRFSRVGLEAGSMFGGPGGRGGRGDGGGDDGGGDGGTGDGGEDGGRPAGGGGRGGSRR